MMIWNSIVVMCFFVYTSYINDAIDFSEFSYGWSRINADEKWTIENITEDVPTQSEYPIKIGESVTFGNNILEIGLEGIDNEIKYWNEFIPDGSNHMIKGEKNGVSYNIEVYKSLHTEKFANYIDGYSKNAYITESITEQQLNDLIHFCGKSSENFWSFSHNCADVAYRAWNSVVNDENKVDPYTYDNTITNTIATPMGVYLYLTNSENKDNIGRQYPFLRKMIDTE